MSMPPITFEPTTVSEHPSPPVLSGGLPVPEDEAGLHRAIEEIVAPHFDPAGCSVRNLFENLPAEHEIVQTLVDFCEFNRHAASNVLTLAAELMDAATHRSHPAFAAFGRRTSSVASHVLRAAAEDELGTHSHSYVDPHDLLMAHTLAAVGRLSAAEPKARPFASAALEETDVLYRGRGFRGSAADALAFRLGVHLASEYSASEEFAAVARALRTNYPKIADELKRCRHAEWPELSGMTWIACHEAVEIEHALHAVFAVRLAEESFTGAEKAHFRSTLVSGYRRFYENRKQFFETLLWR